MKNWRDGYWKVWRYSPFALFYLFTPEGKSILSITIFDSYSTLGMRSQYTKHRLETVWERDIFMALVAKFAKAPLSEVVCGVEFNAPGFSSIHFGLYWQSIQERFPNPPLDKSPIGEIELMASPPSLRRVWFQSVGRNQLIQLQANRFHYNWKRLAEDDEYPHFDVLYPNFEKEWTAFQDWWVELDELPIQSMHYELTYLNQIDAGLGWQSPDDNPKVFSFLDVLLSDERPDLISHDCRMLFALPNEQGTLTVRLNQAKRLEDNANILILELTARSTNCERPLSSWFSDVHVFLVKIFVELLSESAKADWGLRWLEK